MESNENNANPNASNANAEAKNEIHVEEEKKDEQVPQNSQLTQSKTFTQSTQLVKSPEDIIKAKVSKIRSNYNFDISYSNGIIAILKLFNNLLFEKVFNSLNENKNTLNFFKDISAFYMSFSDQIKKSNKISTPFFYFEGGFDFEKLSSFQKKILLIMKKQVAKKENKTRQEIFMVENLGTSFDHSSKDQIIPLVDFVRATK